MNRQQFLNGVAYNSERFIEVGKNAADNINQEDFDSDEEDETSVGDSTIIINYQLSVTVV